MTLNKANGNMYPDIDFTKNILKGKCIHDCKYCYMKRFPQRELKFDEIELKEDMYKYGQGVRIFVGSSTDMFAENIQSEWIHRILDYCCEYDENEYLFQTKNPTKMAIYDENCLFPTASTLGITLESNIDHNLSKAPIIEFRKRGFMDIIHYPNMISIEPILDFDLAQFVNIIFDIKPNYVSIGADSKFNNLPEPKEDKIIQLVQWLRKLDFEVKLKPNLKRLAPSLFEKV